VLEKRLAEVEFLVEDYSIADIATYPWVARFEWHKVNLDEFPNVHRWFKTLGNRPAVQRGMEIP
jgi:GST-like protein